MTTHDSPAAFLALAETYLETSVIALERGFEPVAYQNALHALTIAMRGSIADAGGDTTMDNDHLAGEFARTFRTRVAPLVLRQITSFIEDMDSPLDPKWGQIPSDELHHRVTRIGELVTEVIPGLVAPPGE